MAGIFAAEVRIEITSVAATDGLITFDTAEKGTRVREEVGELPQSTIQPMEPSVVAILLDLVEKASGIKFGHPPLIHVACGHQSRIGARIFFCDRYSCANTKALITRL